MNIRQISWGIGATIGVFFITSLFVLPIAEPSYDDYAATIAFIKGFFFDSTDWNQRWYLLFDTHNEHIILLSRVIAAVYFSLFRDLDFRWLSIIQNLILLGFFASLYNIMRRYDIPQFLAVLYCTIFLFNFSFYQVSFYYWGGSQYYSVFFFCVLSLDRLNKSGKLLDRHLLLALFFGAIAVFSFGNGFLIVLLGCFLLSVKKRFDLLVTWIVFFTVLMAPVTLSSQTHGVELGAFRLDWAMKLFLTYLGSFIYVRPPAGIFIAVNIVLCIVLGTCVIVYWLRLIFNGYCLREPFLYCLLSLPVLTGLVISLARFETKAAGGIAPRYMFFSALIPLTVFCIMWNRQTLNHKSAGGAALFFGAVWALTTVFSIGELMLMNEDVLSRIKAWEKDSSVKLVYHSNPVITESNSAHRRWAVQNNIVGSDK